MTRFPAWLGPYFPFVVSAAIIVVLLSASRMLLLCLNVSHVDSFRDVSGVLTQGLRVDLASLSRLYLIPIVLFAVSRVLPPAWRVPIRWFCIVAVTLSTASFAFFEAVTPTYILEYGTRPERKFFEYLDARTELYGMLWHSYRVEVVVAFAVTCAVAMAAFVLHRRWFEQTVDWRFGHIAVSLPVVIVLLVVAGRSTFDGKPLHPGQVAFTNDLLLNNLALNSLFSAAYARYRMLEEVRPESLYGQMAGGSVRRIVGVQRSRHPFSVPSERKNIVIILEESLGARFVASLGGRNLTPNLERLSHEGWWFERMYATGTRSVRGIEAVLSGFLPTPGRSVVRLVDSQSRFFTLATLLHEAGYRNGFFYGGNSDFDNMRGFTLSNGFDYVFDENNIEHGSFRSTYGYCDDDVFDAIHATLSHHTDQANFIATLTSSNHQPFHFPVSDSDNYTLPLFTRDNAVRYADDALGRFMRRAREADYWDNTIFLIVADHDARVPGQASPTDAAGTTDIEKIFPLEGFHIPALILGGGIAPQRTAYIASQIDLPTTLLSLAGISAPHPMPGVDLTTVPADYPGRAIMQFADHQAHLEGDNLTVLRPSQPPLSGRIVDGRFVTQGDTAAQVRAEHALAYALWPGIVFRAGEYQLGACARSDAEQPCGKTDKFSGRQARREPHADLQFARGGRD